MVRLVVTAVVLGALTAQADRAFPFSWTSSTQAKGTSDATVWLTVRTGRLTPFDLFELRGWASLGVAKNVDVHVGLESDVTLRRYEEKAFDGRVSTLARFRLLEPDDVIGLALLARAGVGVLGALFEARLVLDRVVGDVRLAANSSVERTVTWARAEGLDTRFEHSVAVSLRVTEELTAGFELRARQALSSGAYQGTSFWFGPTLSLSTRWLWLSVGAVAQVAADKAEGDKGNGQPIIFRDDERFGIRVVVGAPLKR